MVKEREPPRHASPRKASNAMDQPPDFLNQPSSPASASMGSNKKPVQPMSRVPHDQTLVAQKLREEPDPYAQRPLFDRPKANHPSVFNIPKPNQPRSEHHRLPSQTNAHSANPSNSGNRVPSYGDSAAELIGKPSTNFRLPSFMSQYGPEYANAAKPGPAPVTVSQPSNAAYQTIPAAGRPMYSSKTGAPVSAGSWRPPQYMQPPPRNVVDLTGDETRDPDDQFDVSRAMASEDGFGSYDPYNYMDQGQASENIKALLEGAFEEDDEDKPKTRLRKRKTAPESKDARHGAEGLADKLKNITVAEPKAKKTHEVEAEEEDEEDDGSIEGLKVKLLPHQIDGVAWMFDKEVGQRKKNGVLPKGGILADDMGLGKTIQALGLIMSNPRPSQQWVKDNPKKKFPEAAGKGTLVVAPLALIKQWEAEIKDKVLPSHKLKVLVHHGQSRTKSFEDLKKYDVVITTYQTLTSEHEASSPEDGGLKVGCFGVHWYRVILDEAHSIKNRNAKMTKGAYALRSVYRWCLTGTPMQNNLDELQSLIRFLQIKPYTELRVWKEQISNPMKSGRGGIAMKRLQYFLKAFMKRRTKDVLQKEGGLNFGKGGGKGPEEGKGFQIVARNVQTVEVDFNEAEREFYTRFAERTEKSLEEMMGSRRSDYIGALVLLLRLRQLCNHRDLIKGNLRQEAAIAEKGGFSSDKDRNLMDDDMNDITSMFSGLTVKTKKCDICQTVIPEDEARAGAIRCADCEHDLNDQSLMSSKSRKREEKKEKKKRRSKKAKKTTNHAAEARKKRNRRVIDDDDDDEEPSDDSEGEWIVGADQRRKLELGTAGGQEDEDAEGGGEWLVSDDAETSDEDASDNDSTDASADTDSDSDSDSGSEENTASIPSTKVRRLLSILRAESDDNKFIVFSEFTSMLDIIEPSLRKAGIRFVRYDGKMRNDDREASLHSLRTDPKTRVLLCSLRCGSLGLNLTAANRVVILEPFWNPFVEEQAIDRVHRLNQTKDVTVYRLTVRDSVEARIIALQEKKRELARAAIEGGKA
ncbi:MAG: hypothetical protein Q9159_003270, partial [Coniocarpon cinnabarinum]